MFFDVNEGQSYLYCEVCKIEWCLACDMVYHVEKPVLKYKKRSARPSFSVKSRH